MARSFFLSLIKKQTELKFPIGNSSVKSPIFVHTHTHIKCSGSIWGIVPFSVPTRGEGLCQLETGVVRTRSSGGAGCVPSCDSAACEQSD